MTIGVGIVGCGVIGPNHASAVALDSRALLRWACDIDLEKAKTRISGAERVTDDYRHLLDDSDCQLIAVCTEHPAHAEIVLASLAAGKHVVCEKPLGVHPDEVSEMVSAARRAEERSLVAAGIFQHRYRPLIRRLKDFIEGGDFGPVQEAEMRFSCTRTADYYASAPWRGTWAGEGGGMMINQAIHTLDLVNWLCGRAVAVEGHIARHWLDCIDVEDQAAGTVFYQNGAVCRLEAVNSAEGGWSSHFTVRCRDGSFTLGEGYRLKAIEHPSTVLQAELHGIDAIRLDGVALPGKACYGDQHALQYQDVFSSITAGRRPMVTLEDSALSNQVVLGLYHSSACDGCRVELPAVDYRHPILPKSKGLVPT